MPSWLARAAAIALPLLLAGCASGWNGGQLYVKKWRAAWRGQHKEATYRVGLPGPGWVPHREKSSQVAWRHRAYPGVIQVRSQCEEHGDSTLEQFTDHLRIDFTAWEIVEQRYLTLVGREALRTQVQAEIDGGPAVAMELTVLKKNGCLFDLSLITTPENYELSLPAYEGVVAGFAFPVRARKKDRG